MEWRQATRAARSVSHENEIVRTDTYIVSDDAMLNAPLGDAFETLPLPHSHLALVAILGHGFYLCLDFSHLLDLALSIIIEL